MFLSNLHVIPIIVYIDRVSRFPDYWLLECVGNDLDKITIKSAWEKVWSAIALYIKNNTNATGWYQKLVENNFLWN